MANVLIGTEEFTDYGKYGQVYLATHDGKGNRLSPMRRSFISFSYGGKYIEDFNLLVAYGDRLNKNIYSEFEDSTSDYETLDGQYYWGTHMSPNTLEFTLATDYMTQLDMERFKKWFHPGVERELILMEHPNRAILARVSSSPSISMIPYEEKITITIGGLKRETSTTVYKGEINLAFVMDEPYWYGRLSYMPEKLNLDTFEEDLAGVVTQENEDCVKVMLEDNVPHIIDMKTSTFIGGNQLVYTEWPRTDSAIVNASILQIVAGISDGVSCSEKVPAYLFYSGTAPSYPTIQFKITPLLFSNETSVEKPSFAISNNIELGIDSKNKDNFDLATDGQLVIDSSIESNYLLTKDGYLTNVATPPYIYVPKNKIATSNIKEYSYIRLSIDDEELFKFEFTTPSIWTGYNQVIQTIYNASQNNIVSALELKEKINLVVNEKYSRAWANYQIGKLEQDESGNLKSGWQNELYQGMIDFLDNLAPATFIINSKTGQATGIFTIKVFEENSEKTRIIEENVGDMIRSDYLIIDYKTLLDKAGQMVVDNCISITSNEQLDNFLILYQNMYL